MHSKAAFAIASVVLAGCAGGTTTTGTGTGPGTGTAGTQNPGDGSTCAQIDLPAESAVVDVPSSEMPASPTLEGGTLESGRYVLTSVELLGPGGQTMAAKRLGLAIEIDGEAFSAVSRDSDGRVEWRKGDWAATGGTIRFEARCEPSAGRVRGTTIDLFTGTASFQVEGTALEIRTRVEDLETLGGSGSATTRVNSSPARLVLQKE